jgi:hypothetical protein
VSWGRDNVCIWDLDTSLGRAQSTGAQPHEVVRFRYPCCWRKTPATTLRIHVRTIPVCYRCPPSARGPRNGPARRQIRWGTLCASAKGIVARTEDVVSATDGFVAGTACLRARPSSHFSPGTSSLVGPDARVHAGPVGPSADDPVGPAGSFRHRLSILPSTAFAAIHTSTRAARNGQESQQRAAHDHAKRTASEPEAIRDDAIPANRHKPEARVRSGEQSGRQHHQAA